MRACFFVALCSDVEVCQSGEESLCVRTITSGLHNGAVNDLSICSEAPLIVSCCTADKTVRVQNYLDRQCELVKQFEFPPLWSEQLQIHVERSAASSVFVLNISARCVRVQRLIPSAGS